MEQLYIEQLLAKKQHALLHNLNIGQLVQAQRANAHQQQHQLLQMNLMASLSGLGALDMKQQFMMQQQAQPLYLAGLQQQLAIQNVLNSVKPGNDPAIVPLSKLQSMASDDLTNSNMKLPIQQLFFTSSPKQTLPTPTLNTGSVVRRKRSFDSVTSATTEFALSDTEEPKLKKGRRASRICSVSGCTTRDKGGGRCAKHGGGRPCKFEGCTKIVAGVRFCSAHGGTRKKLCSHPDCTKGDQGGGFCSSHGGGRRCKVDNCSRRDIGRGLCWSHGGGKRCKIEDCLRCPTMDGFCKLHFNGASS